MDQIRDWAASWYEKLKPQILIKSAKFQLEYDNLKPCDYVISSDGIRYDISSQVNIKQKGIMMIKCKECQKFKLYRTSDSFSKRLHHMAVVFENACNNDGNTKQKVFKSSVHYKHLVENHQKPVNTSLQNYFSCIILEAFGNDSTPVQEMEIYKTWSMRLKPNLTEKYLREAKIFSDEKNGNNDFKICDSVTSSDGVVFPIKTRDPDPRANGLMMIQCEECKKFTLIRAFCKTDFFELRFSYYVRKFKYAVATDNKTSNDHDWTRRKCNFYQHLLEDHKKPNSSALLDYFQCIVIEEFVDKDMCKSKKADLYNSWKVKLKPNLTKSLITSTKRLVNESSKNQPPKNQSEKNMMKNYFCKKNSS